MQSLINTKACIGVRVACLKTLNSVRAWIFFKIYTFLASVPDNLAVSLWFFICNRYRRRIAAGKLSGGGSRPFDERLKTALASCRLRNVRRVKNKTHPSLTGNGPCEQCRGYVKNTDVFPTIQPTAVGHRGRPRHARRSKKLSKRGH